MQPPPQNEARLIADLRDPRNLPGGVQEVELLTTHISLVFRAGQSVFKVKRERQLEFLDYGTVAARQRCCEAELRLNRRLAPDVYLAVLPVRHDEQGHSLNREGTVVDWAVHMRRLPDDRSALALLRAQQLEHRHLDALAARLAQFYRGLNSLPSAIVGLALSLTENFRQTAPFAALLGRSAEMRQVEASQRAWFRDNLDRLEARRARDGHGDLRLEHVYFLDREPTVIDCVEFQDRLRIADPALDVAFLVMDLCRHERRDLAEYFLGRFALESDDYGLYPLIDGYASYRALVRAKVAGLLAADPTTPGDAVTRKREEAGALLHLSAALLQPAPAEPGVMAVGGLIGAGKTTLAEALARRTSAVPISADATRKSMAGLRHEEPAAPAHYGTEFTDRVHNEVLQRAELALQSGRSVILDTTFRSARLRHAARALAERFRARFVLAECQAPEAVLRERLRQRAGAVSDAQEELLPRVMAEYEPVRELGADQHVRVDTTQPLAASVTAVLQALREPQPQPR